MFIPISSVTNSTGIVFGFSGAPYLQVAAERAAQYGKVAVVTAANLASVRVLDANKAVIGAIQITSQDELVDLVAKLTSDKRPYDAMVFHGLAEYAHSVLNKLTNFSAPTQSEWGDMARMVANDLRQLSVVAPVLYVTCDVIKDDDGSPRFNVNPGLMRLILGDFVEKLFVYGSPDNPQVQDDPLMALSFQKVRPDRPADNKAAKTDGEEEKPVPRRINGRRIR